MALWDGNAERIKTDVAALMNAAAGVFGSAPMPTERYSYSSSTAERGWEGGRSITTAPWCRRTPRAFWDKERYEGMLSLFAMSISTRGTSNASAPRPLLATTMKTHHRGSAVGGGGFDELLRLAAPPQSCAGRGQALSEMLGEMIDDVLDHPGYGQQSLAEASEDAWTGDGHRGRDRTPAQAK